MTIDCATSVLEDLDGNTTRPMVDGHITIVDNGSEDGSIEHITAWIQNNSLEKRVTLVSSPHNTGFSGGHNQGIRSCVADFYLVLNSDAVLKPGFCHSILAAAQQYPQAGLLTPRIEYDDGQQQISCFRIHNPAYELTRAAGTGFVQKLFHSDFVALDMPPVDAEIEWASFACILLRHDMVEQIGLMDEGYFLYFEDVEYCLRARRAGWGIHYVPDACAVHFRGGSGPVKKLHAMRKRLPKYYYSSRTRLLMQAHGHLGLFLANIGWHLGRCIAYSRLLVGKPVPKANLGEASDIWTNFWTPLGDRYAPDGTGFSGLK